MFDSESLMRNMDNLVDAFDSINSDNCCEADFGAFIQQASPDFYDFLGDPNTNCVGNGSYKVCFRCDNFVVSFYVATDPSEDVIVEFVDQNPQFAKFFAKMEVVDHYGINAIKMDYVEVLREYKLNDTQRVVYNISEEAFSVVSEYSNEFRFDSEKEELLEQYVKKIDEIFETKIEGEEELLGELRNMFYMFLEFSGDTYLEVYDDFHSGNMGWLGNVPQFFDVLNS